ncbi:TetR/AcrR family transcriptional regulator [Desulfotignum phosphitoxidans]|uniref:Transcriptional regulator, TetR family n=1 Tax=Desulfotignum phosphitoxidans DSM 13687 TaxID=1286635 RepID=S0G3G5_9BACT|nr:TetR/AcrR family transcriptional regulator [Desulfotignum phosphitoxidans]EMS78727.1 transcriptional regulator, TetR family [Desulfotignum phosphitoxidans DSM 13687]
MPKQVKREDIIRTAMELLAAQGFHGAPMSMIAEKAGVGVGTIYRYFENRDILIKTIYQECEQRLVAFLTQDYPYGQPVRICFFHIAKGLVAYFTQNPMEFKYSEQFHYSPFGEAHRRNRIFKAAGQPDIFMELYERGLSQQVIKHLPPTVFFNLAFAPIAWSLRDHILEIAPIDDALAQVLAASCWDSVKK